MNKEEYKKLVDEYTPKEDKVKNAFIAFLVGGVVGVIAELLAKILQQTYGIETTESYAWVCIIVIIVASLFTSLGFFDTWVSKAKAGLFLPTSGFAHSVTSSALDYRKDGMITGLGSNFFKLAGCVILFGIVSAFFVSILGVIIYG